MERVTHRPDDADRGRRRPDHAGLRGAGRARSLLPAGGRRELRPRHPGERERAAHRLRRGPGKPRPRSIPRCGEPRRGPLASSASSAAGCRPRPPAGRRPRNAGTRSSVAGSPCGSSRSRPVGPRSSRDSSGSWTPTAAEPAEPVRTSLDGAPGVVAASPRLLRALRPPADADRRLPAVRAGARSSERDRGRAGRALRLASRTRIPSISPDSRRRPSPAGSPTTACRSGFRSWGVASTM